MQPLGFQHLVESGGDLIEKENDLAEERPARKVRQQMSDGTSMMDTEEPIVTASRDRAAPRR